MGADLLTIGQSYSATDSDDAEPDASIVATTFDRPAFPGRADQAVSELSLGFRSGLAFFAFLSSSDVATA